MRRRIFLLLLGLALMVVVPPWGGNLAFGNAGPAGATWYANSPSGLSPLGSDTGTALHKFVDSLPGVGPAGANNLGQYIPLAMPVTQTACPDSDYYQIGYCPV